MADGGTMEARDLFERLPLWYSLAFITGVDFEVGLITSAFFEGW